MSKHETLDLHEIGGRLRTIRSYQRKTQAMMSKELGISLSHYSKLEIGIGNMSHGLALALCRQFDVPEEWLLHGEGPEPDLANLKILPAHARPVVAAPSVSVPSECQLEGIMEIVLQENFKNLAEQIASAMGIPLSRAMAILAREKLRANASKVLTEKSEESVY